MRIHAASLHYFDRVCRCGSIREASRQLNISASSVGRALSKLEEEAGVALFERLPAGLRLTAAGERLARHVATVLQDAERTQNDLAGLRQTVTGTLAVVCSDSLNTDLLPTVLERLHQRHPAVRVSARSGGLAATLQAIMQGRVDLGLLFVPPRFKRMQPIRSWRFPLGAILPAGHPLATRHAVSFADCVPYPMILGNDDLTTTKLLHSLIEPWRSKLVVHAEVGSILLMATLIARGLGIGFSSQFGFEAALADGRLVFVPLDSSGPVQTRLAAYARAEQSSPAVLQAFAAVLEEELARRVA